jgi:hypothetical protein
VCPAMSVKSLPHLARHQPHPSPTCPGLSTISRPEVVAAHRLAIVAAMSHIERLTERAISLAIAEVDEDLAVARLVFLAQDDHAAVDAAIGACLARTERTLYTRWRAISFLVRVRYEDHRPRSSQPHPAPAAPTAARGGPRGAPGARGQTTSQAKTAAGR